MRVRLRVGLMVYAAALWAPPASIAQGPTGALNGQIADISGAAMPGVTVTARHRDTGEVRTAVTNIEGRCALAALPTVLYDLASDAVLTRAQHHGDKRVTHLHYALPVNGALRRPRRLECRVRCLPP